MHMVREGLGSARLLATLATFFVLAGCETTLPYRSADSNLTGPVAQDACSGLYSTTDKAIVNVAVSDYTVAQREAILAEIEKRIQGTRPPLSSCWKSSFERHSDYDLYYMEIDDAGQPTDIANGSPYVASQIHLIEQRLREGLSDKNSAYDIVVFTHGWHGDAAADNGYSIEFKSILEDIASRERTYQAQVSNRPQVSPAAPAARAEHRVIGIEMAWRGDSFENPAIPFVDGSKNALNAWDRRNAASTIAHEGTPQELLAFLNEIYLDNSCRGEEAAQPTAPGVCDRVHLLALGHSFGALIDFEALVGRLESGLSVRSCHRAYGYGDMTILLNPAFEAARYRSLFENAKDRTQLLGPYYDSAKCGASAGDQLEPHHVQIPTIVMLQSLGDTATKTAFPLLLSGTNEFKQTVSSVERADTRTAVGWQPDFRTHTLAPLPGATNRCDFSLASWKSFCPFQGNVVAPTDRGHLSGMELCLNSKQHDLPDYMPLWVVAVDPKIMRNHDDFWNPEVVRLVSILFVDAYQQTEEMHGHLDGQANPTQTDSALGGHCREEEGAAARGRG